MKHLFAGFQLSAEDDLRIFFIFFVVVVLPFATLIYILLKIGDRKKTKPKTNQYKKGSPEYWENLPSAKLPKFIKAILIAFVLLFVGIAISAAITQQ